MYNRNDDDDTQTTTGDRPQLRLRDLDPFDLQLGKLHGLTGAVESPRATKQTRTDMLGLAETYIIQTIRVPDIGDTVFLQVISAARSLRIAIPPAVVATIARQLDGLTTSRRRRGARQAVETKRKAGIPVGNPEALAKARAGGRKARRRRTRKGGSR